jgi:Protein of unknown function (DUF1997)
MEIYVTLLRSSLRLFTINYYGNVLDGIRQSLGLFWEVASMKQTSKKQMRLVTTQAVELQVPSLSFSIEDYLQSPDRLIQTLANADQIQKLEDDRYRFSLAPLSVLNLTIKPIVDLAVWLDETQKVQIESIAFEMQGLEGFHDRFDFKLLGELYPIHTPKEVLLRGSALLRIDIDLPMPFRMMPRSVVESAGNTVLNAALSSIKGKLLQNLIRDYQYWCREKSGAIVMGSD